MSEKTNKSKVENSPKEDLVLKGDGQVPAYRPPPTKPRKKAPDAGARWLALLTDDKVHALCEYAYQINSWIPSGNDNLSEGQFNMRIAQNGHDKRPAFAKELLVKIIGSPAQADLIKPYDVWWAMRYCAIMKEMLSKQGYDPDTAHEKIRGRMKMPVKAFFTKLQRKDTQKLIGLLMAREAADLEGDIALVVATNALKGDIKFIEAYYRHVHKKEEVKAVQQDFDPTKLTEEELRQQVKSLRKSLGRGHREGDS